QPSPTSRSLLTIHITTLILSPPSFFFLLPPPPPTSTLFPYTTLFRSLHEDDFRVRVATARRAVDRDRNRRRLRQRGGGGRRISRSEEHTSELQSRFDLVCRLLLEKKKK